MLEVQNPALVSAIVAGAIALATKGLDIWIARRKARDKHRHTDRELLSKDENDFRLTIIRQLQQCNDSQKELRRENAELQKGEIELRRRVAHLEHEIRLMEDLLQANHIELPFRRKVDGTHA